MTGIDSYRESLSHGSLFVHTPKSSFTGSFSLDSIEGQENVAVGNLDEVWFEITSGKGRTPINYKT